MPSLTLLTTLPDEVSSLRDSLQTSLAILAVSSLRSLPTAQTCRLISAALRSLDDSLP